MEEVVEMIVIGGGVVGAAVFRALALEGYSAVLLEKNANFVHGASSGNSGIACTGYDAPKGSLEQRCIRRAMELNPTVYKELGLPSDPTGSLVVAWTKEELQSLPAIVHENHAIGDTSVRLLTPEELYKLEPNLASGALGAVFVPGEVIIEPWLIPIAYIHHGIRNGGRVFLNHEVVRGEFHQGIWTLFCANDVSLRSRCVLNCAGLYGDIVECIHKTPMPFHIRPRKGQYTVFNAPPGLVTRVIQPVPTDRTKGVFVFRNLYGHVIVGPTAEDQDSRDVAENTPQVLSMLHQVAIRQFPTLGTCSIVGSYAGLRPATEHRDYQIQFDAQQHWLTVGGIRSTGVTASLGIAEYVVSLLGSTYQQSNGRHMRQSFQLPPLDVLATTHYDPSTNSIQLEGLVHVVTHPLSRFGMQKLQLNPSRL